MAQHHRRPSRRRRRRRAQRRIALVVLGIVALVVLVVLAWRDMAGAKDRLIAAADRLEGTIGGERAVRTEQDRQATLRDLEGIIDEVEAVKDKLRRSVPVGTVGRLPLLNTQRGGAMALVDDAATAARAGVSLVRTLDTLAGRSIEGGVVPLSALRQMEGELRRAERQLRDGVRSDRWLFGTVRTGRRLFNVEAASAARRLGNGADVLEVARAFAGEGGPRRYFIAGQNNAEMRDQGMTLSWGILRIDRGRLDFERTGRIRELAQHASIAIPVPERTQAFFGFVRPTDLWQNVNATADFPWSCRAMLEMYRVVKGEKLDGVIALDVPAVAGLLRTVGPVTVAGWDGPITASNAGRVLLHDLYNDVAVEDKSERTEILADVIKALIDKVTAGQYDPVALGRDLATAAAGGHVRMYSTRAEEEKVFHRVGLGGAPGAIRPDRTFHLAVENGTPTKLDYYVKPTVRMQVRLDAEGTARVRTTVKVVNTAPPNGKPSYQLGPSGVVQTRPGQYRALVWLWAPQRRFGGPYESGLDVTYREGFVEPGSEQDLVFNSVIPDAVRNGRLELRLVPQPRLAPMPLSVELEAPKWRVADRPRIPKKWDKTVTVSFGVDRR